MRRITIIRQSRLAAAGRTPLLPSMKITRIALALSGMFCLNVHAQSSVEFYGTIDVGIRSLTHANADGDHLVKMSSNGEFFNNRIGIKGNEVLGNGLNAHFQFESGWNGGTGELDNTEGRLFNRYSLVGLNGDFGKLEFGRIPSLSCKIISFYDPFEYHYVHTIPLAGFSAGDNERNFPGYPFGTMIGTRFSNDFQYIGTSGGLTYGVEYAFGEKHGATKDGSSYAVAVGYANERFTIGGAYTRQRPDVSAANTAIFRNQSQVTFGGSWRFGSVRVAGGYMRTSSDDAAALPVHQAKNTWIGASHNFTPRISVTVGYYRTTFETGGNELARRNFSIIAATYALSARTNLYAAVDNAALSGLATLASKGQTSQTGISLGLNHAF